MSLTEFFSHPIDILRGLRSRDERPRARGVVGRMNDEQRALARAGFDGDENCGAPPRRP